MWSADFSDEYIRAHPIVIVPKTAVANARWIVVITGASSVITTSPPSKLWTISKMIAKPIALDGPAGRGFIFHTNIVLAIKSTPVTIVSNL